MTSDGWIAPEIVVAIRTACGTLGGTKRVGTHGDRFRSPNLVKPFLCFVVAGLLAGSIAVAQEPALVSDESEPTQEVLLEEEMDDIDLFDLDVPTVVTAARREQKITAVPHAMSIITAEDIRLSGARTVPDALRLSAGVDVADLSYGNAAASPRGLHGFVSRQVLVLVDGRQIFDSFFGGALWGSWPFQLEDIQRIEIIRGPAGVTWGANAVNGVINIITKDPADQLGFKITSSAASRGSFKEHLGYAWADDKLRLRVSGEYEASDGFKKGGSILRNVEDDYRVGRIALHAVYDAGPDDTLTFSGGTGLLDGGFPQPPLGGYFVSRNPGSQASYLLTKWDHKIEEDNALQLTAYVNDFQGSSGIKAVDYRYQQLAFQLSHTFKPADDHTLTWGIDNRTDILDASNSDPQLLSKSFVATNITGLYLQDEWQFAPKWTFDLGGRIDYDFYGGFQPSARGALSYELTETSSVYGAVSRAFQMPPAAVRFLELPMLNGLSATTIDRDEEAQSLLAYELGYRGKFFERLDMNLNLFANQYRNISTLAPKLGPPGLIRLHGDDVGKGILYGLELDAKYKATEKLTLLGNYTFQQLEWQSDTPFLGVDAVEPPEHKFMVGARYSPFDDLHLSAHLYYVDATRGPNPSNPFLAQHIDPYFRLDLRAEYEFWDDRASIAVGVRNLLDENHLEGSSLFINDAEVSRMFFVEMSVAFE